MILNGWQHIKPVEGGSIPSFGTQVTYKPTPAITLNSSTFLGTDKPDSTRRMRYFHNFYGIFQLNDKLAAAIDFDIGVEQRNTHSSGMNTWFSSMFILRYTPIPKTAIAIRAEYYDDRHGVIIESGTPHGFKNMGLLSPTSITASPATCCGGSRQEHWAAGIISSPPGTGSLSAAILSSQPR